MTSDIYGVGHGMGIYRCYCQNATREYVLNKTKIFFYENKKNSEVEEVIYEDDKLCKEYLDDWLFD